MLEDEVDPKVVLLCAPAFRSALLDGTRHQKGGLTLSNAAETLPKRHLAQEIESTHFKPFDHVDAILVLPAQRPDLGNERV